MIVDWQIRRVLLLTRSSLHAPIGIKQEMPEPRWKTVVQGIRFGLLLQLAVGPVCLFVFKTGADSGAMAALSAVCAVALVDTVYIGLAAIGVAQVVRGRNAERLLRVGGALVIAFFGADVLLSAIGYPLLPNLGMSTAMNPTSIPGTFQAALILTGGNPLTIVFWAGVFGAKISTGHMQPIDIGLFSFGCVVSTIVFLAVVGSAGAIAATFLTPLMIVALNLAVGSALVYFAARMLVPKQLKPGDAG